MKKEKIKAISKDFILFIFIAVMVFSIIAINPISNLDEIWNYNTARAITQNLIPYKDISMITTPLLPMITALFLKLIANEVIVSRVLASVLWGGVLFSIFKILKLLIKEENTCLIITALLGLLFRDCYCIDYNILSLMFSLIILYIELKNIDKPHFENNKTDFLIGILAGLTVCTKQSIGAILAIIVVGYKIIFVQNKKEFIEYLKTVFKRIIGILIPMILVFIYLIATNSLQDFINYAVLGISTFSNKIPYAKLMNNDKKEIQILSRIMPFILLAMAVLTIVLQNKKKKENIGNIDNKILTMLIYSLSTIIIMYPISDEIHFLIASTITFIGLAYILYLLGIAIYNKINLQSKKKIYKITSLLISIILIAFIAVRGIENITEYIKQEKNETIEHYKNIQISEYLQERINEIDNFILEQEKENKKVYILDAEAAIYMIPINNYNKDYDMFLKGNIGKDGQEGQIQKIKQKETNEIILIRKRNLQSNWQTPTEVVNYVRENLEFMGEVSIYEVYR
ncbi:MAG: hypothetical protein BHW00_02925 [Clostridium sp. 26_22]|nr:MAG: hypothetical protein BHW00_02925 [Clostridium sp. 26_22]